MMRISWIESGELAASGVPLGLKDIEDLHAQGIRAILTVTEHPLTIQNDIDDDVFKTFDMDYCHIPIVDQHPPHENQVPEIVEYINRMRENGSPVLVHCQAGGGRTGTVLHLYYLAHGLSLEETKQKIKTTRPASQFFMLSDVQREFVEAYATQHG